MTRLLSTVRWCSESRDCGVSELDVVQPSVVEFEDHGASGGAGVAESSSDIQGSVPFTPSRLSDIFGSETESSSSDEECVEDLCERLHRWYVKHRVNHVQLQGLLAELRPFHPGLPKSSRSIVHTPTSTRIVELNNGTYVHIGLVKGLEARLQNGTRRDVSKLHVDINIDGLTYSESSSVDVWPILARSVDLFDCKPFVVGIFCGNCLVA